MENYYLVLIVIFLVCLVIRSGYELLKDAGKVNPESKLIFAIIFTIMCTLWVCWFSLCPLDPFQIKLPDAIRWGGFTLFVAGMILAIGALIQLQGLENIDHLVTGGFFRKIRHPMYTGFILWILGWSIYHGAGISMGFGWFGIINIVYWRRLEEVRMQMQYGDTYHRYQMTTWF